jgi:2-keto-4-pentenoate hydratase/2-oxohepta-3-ene-1,7-dioic acid hydratase in catechol pathway
MQQRLGAADLKSALVHPQFLNEGERVRPDEAIDFGDLRFLPVVPNPDKIFCVGLNYRSHAQETNNEVGQYPVLFSRVAASQVGHREAMVVPLVSTEFDYEGELAIIIGRAGRAIPRDQALGHVAGYACYNDGSVRDWQRHTRQFTPGKNFWRTGSFGPWMVDAAELPDPSALTLTTRLNGQVVQQASTSELVFSVPELIEYISTFVPLAPGDVIVSGTPAGVGARRNPQLFMKDGDEVEVEISGIGTLFNRVTAETDISKIG